MITFWRQKRPLFPFIACQASQRVSEKLWAASMGCGQMRKKRRVCQAVHTLLRGESVRDCQMLSWGMSDRLCQSVIQTMEHDTEGFT